MAEINFNNLYNQLKPMEKRFYDQQFQKSYNPNQENIMLSSQPAYEQMKAVYEAQQDVPEKSALDKALDIINPFSSASAAEMPQVPNLTYRNIDLPFDLRTGVTNTTAASPFLKSMADIDASGNVNSDLINQLIMENEMKTKNISFPNRSPFLFPEEQTGITSTDQAQNFNFLNDITPSFGVANEPDVEQVEFLGKEPNFLQKLAQFIPFAGEKSLGRAIINMLPKLSPEAQNIRNFYGSQFGLTPTGQVASGIMKGYNPVSGSNLLNRFTGGLVPAKRIGLSNAIQKRISNILGRKIAQTDISRARVKKLKELRDREIRDRADFGESLSSIGKSTFTGKGQAFEKRSGGSSGKKGTSSERNYGGR
jgi:hypothetical protein